MLRDHLRYTIIETYGSTLNEDPKCTVANVYEYGIDLTHIPIKAEKSKDARIKSGKYIKSSIPCIRMNV